MIVERVFAARLLRLPLSDDTGAVLGRVEDLVLAPSYAETPPRVLGLVGNIQRRHIFVNVNRVAGVGPSGVRLQGGSVDLRHFQTRPGELLLSALLGRRVGDEIVMDVALHPTGTGGWEVGAVALGGGRALYRRTRRVADWQEAREIFDGGPIAAQLAALRDMKPTDVARRVRALPPGRRAELTEAIPDEQLADVLEELPEAEQVTLLAAMDLERVADVVEEMEPDDASDLLAAMPVGLRTRLLAALAPEDAETLRRLLRYDPTSAGGLMTTEPVIVPPETSVAEVLARLREPELRPAVAAQAFVCEPPTETPTGAYLGSVGFQRLLREPPSHPVAGCIEDESSVRPDLIGSLLAERFAAYNLAAVAVCDEAGRFVGAVTVDDVLDHLLPTGWRERRR